MRSSVLFNEPPETWGLRGDPYLWRELEDRREVVDLTTDAHDLKRLLESEYQNITAQPIDVDEDVFVERFAHGGMSSGFVCPEFWRETAIPLLVSRYEEYI